MSDIPEMVERIALTLKRALGAALQATPLPQPSPNPTDWSATGGFINLEDVARTVIAAMREPTEVMKRCSPAVHWGYHCHVCGGLTEGWYAMMDAATDSPRPS